MDKVSFEEQELFKFMLKNRKWDNKKSEWSIPKPEDFHLLYD